MCQLGIKKVTTNHFALESENIKEVVNVLFSMKSLTCVTIDKNRWNEYKLTPNDLSLFKDLPVKQVDLSLLTNQKDQSQN